MPTLPGYNQISHGISNQHGGTGIYCRNDLDLKEIPIDNDRIIGAVCGEWIVIETYAPTNDKDERTRTKFYKHLENFIISTRQ